MVRNVSNALVSYINISRTEYILLDVPLSLPFGVEKANLNQALRFRGENRWRAPGKVGVGLPFPAYPDPDPDH
jgi:hypothetical protein